MISCPFFLVLLSLLGIVFLFLNLHELSWRTLIIFLFLCRSISNKSPLTCSLLTLYIFPLINLLSGNCVKMKAVRNVVYNAKTKLDTRVSEFTNFVKNVISVFLTISAIGWCSAFIYCVFYLYYVPVVYQEKPVYFHFRYKSIKSV